ncbi:hypothetical protein V1522DRAFT_150366 [Lipomyces starkeyi]
MRNPNINTSQVTKSRLVCLLAICRRALLFVFTSVLYNYLQKREYTKYLHSIRVLVHFTTSDEREPHIISPLDFFAVCLFSYIHLFTTSLHSVLPSKIFSSTRAFLVSGNFSSSGSRAYICRY